jgi:hypothetical protein
MTALDGLKASQEQDFAPVRQLARKPEAENALLRYFPAFHI